MLCSAQVPDTAPVASAPPAKTSSAAQGQPSFLGKDVPVLDPSSEILSWDGLRWNITNQRIFESRFEKYLNAAEETGVQDKKYRDILRAILDKLAPTRVNNKSIDEAFRLLPTASGFEIDARLCDALADAVYSAWRSQDASARLVEANAALEQERKVLEWNAKLAGQGNQMEAPPSNKDAVGEWEKQQQLKRDLTVGPYATRLAEVLALVKANQIKRELSQFQTKIEFQALIMQFFLQRRFQHVLIATRFYRAVFSDGNTKLEVGTDARIFLPKAPVFRPRSGRWTRWPMKRFATPVRVWKPTFFWSGKTNCKARPNVWRRLLSSANTFPNCARCRVKKNARPSIFPKKVISSFPRWT